MFQLIAVALAIFFGNLDQFTVVVGLLVFLITGAIDVVVSTEPN